MKKLVLAAVCALGLGLAASTGASAAPIGSALDGLKLSPIQQAQTVVISPGRRYGHRHHRPVCRSVTTCRIGRHGRRICRTERICRR